MAALYWMFIGSAVSCYAYAAYVISCAIALTFLYVPWVLNKRTEYDLRVVSHKKLIIDYSPHIQLIDQFLTAY